MASKFEEYEWPDEFDWADKDFRSFKKTNPKKEMEQMDKCPWCGRNLIKADGYIECENYMCHYGLQKQREEDDA